MAQALALEPEISAFKAKLFRLLAGRVNFPKL
jgi:hypothetical protein